MAWRISGEYFENCNCTILCPCITSSMQAPADNERCYVPLICNIREGEADGVSLNGLSFILVVDSPQVMASGGWRVAVYIDEKANENQRSALGGILSGQQGGAPAALGGLIGEQLGVKFVPINYESDGLRKHVVVPGIMEFEVEGIVAPQSSAVMEIVNVFHPMGSNLAIAKSLRGHFSDYGLTFDNTGKNGHYREFAWQA
jgi:hypothetical protein